MTRVLVVDDDAAVRLVLSALLEQEGFDVDEAADGVEALNWVHQHPVDVVLSDLRMPRMGGQELLQELAGTPPLIMLTAHGDVEHAVQAMRAGAVDFLTKPFQREAVLRALERGIAAAEAEAERAPKAPRSDTVLLGESPPMVALRAALERVANTSATVLLQGETGTGKELAARTLHAASKRPGAFVAICCGALPLNLIEAELFGHEVGAFTGAVHAKPGRFRLAEGGTVFLDEIAELPLEAQAKLLRVLESRDVTPVGSGTPVPVDVRVVAATHQDLPEAVEQGRFREDLYYRLAVVTVRLPSLRERPEDIARLARVFFAEAKSTHGRTLSLAPEAFSALMQRAWPGNVRQLRNACERLVLTSDAECLDAAEVHRILGDAGSGALDLGAQVHRVERATLERGLRAAEGNRTLAARLLGISRRTLYNKLEEHGLAGR